MVKAIVDTNGNIDPADFEQVLMTVGCTLVAWEGEGEYEETR